MTITLTQADLHELERLMRDMRGAELQLLTGFLQPRIAAAEQAERAAMIEKMKERKPEAAE